MTGAALCAFLAAAEIEWPGGTRAVQLGDDAHVYAGFIESYKEIAAPAPEGEGTHWNGRVTPQRSALDGGWIGESDAASLRKNGFTSAVIAPEGGKVSRDRRN